MPRDPTLVLRFPRSVQRWLADLPNVRDARPSTTPCCGLASAPPGASLLLHGHGTRERSVRGVLAPGKPPAFHVLRVRRYRCTACGTTCTVVPLDVLPRKHFGALTIALAFALYGALHQSLEDLWARLNPSRLRGPSARGWDSVLTWLASLAALFPEVRPCPPDFDSRQRAERAALTLAARVPDEALPLPSRIALAVCHPP